MKKTEKNRFVISVNELDQRLEEQSILTAVFAVVGTLAAGNASACGGTSPTDTPCATPSCSIFSW